MASNGRPTGPHKREAVALALAGGASVREASEPNGVGSRTVWRWLAEDDAFTARVQELRQELFGQAVGKLCKLSGKSADTLGTLLDSETETTRLTAARAILDSGPKLRDAADLEARLVALEKKLAERESRAFTNNATGQGGARPRLQLGG